MNVKMIVAEYLKTHKYAGLCCLDVPCGCLLEDLAPCGEMSEKCRPGHREDVDKETACDCDGCGEDHWHIVPEGTWGVMDESDAKQWVCECRAVCDPGSSEWRWNGMEWEHHHGYPIGHVPARKKIERPKFEFGCPNCGCTGYYDKVPERVACKTCGYVYEVTNQMFAEVVADVLERHGV